MAIHHGPDCPCDRCQSLEWTGSGTLEDPYKATETWYTDHLPPALQELEEAATKLCIGGPLVHLSRFAAISLAFDMPRREDRDRMIKMAAANNREMLADCLGVGPDLVDDIVAVWAKR